MSSFKNADAGVIVDHLIKTIQEQRDYLSEIDGKIGDGDHGINMNKGVTMCEDKLKGQTYNCVLLGKLFWRISEVLWGRYTDFYLMSFLLQAKIKRTLM